MKIEYTELWFKQNEHLIHTWFDKETFLWECSHIIAKQCPRYIELWFDKDLFDWSSSFYLIKYCSRYFETWFNKTNVLKWNNQYDLMIHCPTFIEKWFDKDTFDWDEYPTLMSKCGDYKHVWKEGYDQYVLFNKMSQYLD
jgi:hypothetical protein